MKIKTIHIHTNESFISSSKIFDGAVFDNTIVFIQRNETIIKTDSNIVVFGDRDVDIENIVLLCNRSELVVLYDLDLLKSRIALSLSKNTTIIWRFFGYELYSRRPELFKSFLTHKYEGANSTLKKRIKKLLFPVYATCFNRNGYYALSRKAMKRIDIMLGLCVEEYLYLIEKWAFIPVFIRVPNNFTIQQTDYPDFSCKYKQQKPIVIIGNSRVSYNNHIDIIELIEKCKTKSSYSFQLLFNYGDTGEYSNAVRKLVSDKNHFTLIEDFIPKDEFLNFYKDASALVINSYRQMAAANIRMAIQGGTKVYMNNRNAHKTFLQNEGFRIFSIEDFESDLINNRLQFDENTAIHNIKNIQRFNERYTKQDFQNTLIGKLKSKKN
jgi:hypothetical protein